MERAESESPSPETPGEPPGTPPEPFPWPPGGDGSAIDAFLATWSGAVLSPTAFFSRMPEPPPLGPALVYYLIIGVFAAGASLFWSTVGNALGLSPLLETQAAWEPLVGFLLAPFVLAVLLGVSTVVIHLILMLTGGANRGLATTATVLCFAYSPTVFAVVPLAGSLVGGLWVFVSAIIGLREAHRTDTGRAAAAVLLPGCLAILLGALFLVLLVMAGVGLGAAGLAG